MNEKMIEAAIEGNFSQFSEMLQEELNRRVHKLIESRIQDVTDATWNVCESCDEDDVWDDEDVEDLYHDENDPYEEEEDLEGMNIGEGDDHDTRELHLYASNHADLHRQRMTPIHKNLRNKQAAGTYDSEKAHKAFGHAAKDAADRYHKEHGHRFSVATRKAVAAKMRDEFEADSKAGEHDHLLHKKHKGHKVESVEYTDEAIEYDSAGDSKGRVTGKGKRDRSPKGEVKVKYKGSNTYGDEVKLPINARKMGRLIKTARKIGTSAYDSANLRNPRLTRDHVEHEVDEAVRPALRMGVDFKYKAPSDAEKKIMKQEREKAAKMRATPDRTSPAGRAAQRMIDARKKMDAEMANRKESIEVDENYEARKVMRKMGVQGVITPKGEIKVPMRDRKRLDAELKKNNIKNYTMSSESVEVEEGAEYRAQHFGGMKAAQDAPSYKRYFARLKAEREARKKEFERAQAAKKATKEEVEVVEGKKSKKAKKDHDGDGKIETSTQEWKGSRDNAIKRAIAARGGN